MMKRVFYIALIAILFCTNANAQSKEKLPFIGTKEFYDEANANTIKISISKTGALRISYYMREVKETILFKGSFTTIIKIKNEGGFLFENGFLYLLNENGNKRLDCIKMAKDYSTECPCKFNIKTTVLQ
jgi:hypothetical protein